MEIIFVNEKLLLIVTLVLDPQQLMNPSYKVYLCPEQSLSAIVLIFIQSNLGCEMKHQKADSKHKPEFGEVGEGLSSFKMLRLSQIIISPSQLSSKIRVRSSMTRMVMTVSVPTALAQVV